jgi:DNA-binding response OmpR family regulator
VLTANGGEAGVEMFDPESIDVVITDIMMPKMSGHTTVDAIRKASADVPILDWSGRASLETLDRLRDQGATEFIGKPFAADELLATVHRLCCSNNRQGR